MIMARSKPNRMDLTKLSRAYPLLWILKECHPQRSLSDMDILFVASEPWPVAGEWCDTSKKGWIQYVTMENHAFLNTVGNEPDAWSM
jgi:hypothetical protein